jgi:transcriptional regulator with XRE-family HTH domain
MIETFRKSLGKVVQQRRNQLGLTQQQLADRAELHRTYISDVERGARNLSLESIYQISKGLSLRASTLFAQAEDGAQDSAAGR